ncbi:hypothetical protein EXS54_02675 [Patescibacteria group bacterium]|nr:hypothetical protein [Patescibacteria group bacterium]
MPVLNINLLQKEQRQVSRMSQATTIVMIVTGSIVVMTLLITVFLYTTIALRSGQKQGLVTERQESEAKIAELNKTTSPFYPDMNLSQDAKAYQGQIDGAKVLVENHKYFTLYISEIAENTPANVTYTSFTSDSLNRLAVSGSANTYEAVAKLVESFNKLSFAKSATLQEAKLDSAKVGKGGSVSFVMVIELKPASELKKQLQKPTSSPGPKASNSPAPSASIGPAPPLTGTTP